MVPILFLLLVPLSESLIPRIRYYGPQYTYTPYPNGRPWNYAPIEYSFSSYALNWLSYSFPPRPEQYLRTGHWVGGELSKEIPFQWPDFVKSSALVEGMASYQTYANDFDVDCHPSQVHKCILYTYAEDQCCPYVAWDSQYGFTNHTKLAWAILKDHVAVNDDRQLSDSNIFADSLTDFENRNTFYRYIESSFTGAKVFDGCYQPKPPGEHPITLQSVIHPAGEPYTVQCLTCSRNALRTGLPKAFWMLHNRNPFQPFNEIDTEYYIKLLEHNIRTTVAATMYIWHTRQTRTWHGDFDHPTPRQGAKPDRSYMWTLWEQTKEYADKLRIPQHTVLRDKAFQAESISNTRALYFAERVRERIVAFDNGVRFSPPDGRLFVDPDPAGYGEMITQWNAATYGCSEIIPIDENQKTFYRAPQVMVNVDTLIRPYWFLGSSEGKLKPIEAKARGAVFDYWRLGHKQKKHKAPETINDTESNLQLRMHWEPWSLCSACCCTTLEECGHDHLFMICSNVESVKRRRGYAVLSKIDPTKTINYRAPAIADQLNQHNGADPQCNGKCQWEELDRYLSFSPYLEEGIPCFSTLLLNHRYMNIYMALAPMQRFPGTKLLPFHTYYEEQERDKQFGMYFEVINCTKEEQNCTIWWEERRKLYGDSDVKDDHGGDTDGTSSAHHIHPCSNVKFKEIQLVNKEQTATVFIGQSYKIVWVERSGPSTSEVIWSEQSNNNKCLPAYDNKRDCIEQHQPLFVDPNKRDLLMIKIQRNDVAKKVLTAQVKRVEGKPETRTIKFVAKQPGLEDPKLFEILLWLGVIGGVLVLFGIGGCALYVFGKATNKEKKKRKDKSSEGTDKSNEDKNKNK